MTSLELHLQRNSRGPPSEAKPHKHLRPPFLKFLHVSHGQNKRSQDPISLSLQQSTESRTCARLSQPPAIPSSVEGAPPSPPLRRYETRRPPTTLGESSSRPKKLSSRPPKKKARVSALVEPLEPSLEPQPPTTESQIPSGMTPEVIIKRPMVTQPPIEGNLDCRARPFHYELCFDRETFRLQPELRDSFHLL